MQSARLLKWFFDVFGRLLSQPEHDSAEKSLYLWRVLQAAAQPILHPTPRFLCGAQDRIAPAVANQRAVLRVPDEKRSAHIVPRKISTHVKFAWISRRGNWLGRSQKFQFIAKFGRPFPTHLPDCMGRLVSAFEFN